MDIAKSENIDIIILRDEQVINDAHASLIAKAAKSEDEKPEGRTLRPRPSVINRPASAKGHKRQKTEKEVARLQSERAEKKVKLEGQKAMTMANNTRKINIDLARKRWLRHHIDLFIPLLPQGSHLVESIRRDVPENAPYVPMHQLDEQPSLIKGGMMKDYQLQGLSFLAWMYENGMNCILGDEMGLGKTLQTLSLFAYIKEKSSEPLAPHLILCPLSVLSSWMSEIERWLPSFRALRFHAQQRERDHLKQFVNEGAEFDICVTTYEQYTAEDHWFKSRRWTYCVLDEGHKIKRVDTNLAHSLQGIGAHYRLILSGTPLQNDMLELWGLFHWLYPTIFTSASEHLFKDSFNLRVGQYDLKFLTDAQKLLSTVMLRRTKSFVELSVPPREEVNVYIPMSELQRFWTMRLITRMDTLDLHEIFPTKFEDGAEDDDGRRAVQESVALQLQQSKSGEANQWKRLMNLVMQLRQVCDHPYLLDDAEPDPYSIGEHLVASSSKLIAIDKILNDILPKGERVLIFSQFVGMLNLLDDFMRLRDIPFARIDGSTLRPRRALDIKLFQQEQSPYQVFLISTKAGGLGINLTKATHVIMCDSDFNPQNDLQAIARAHRIGQTKTVKVYRLICAGSVEDQMFEFIRRKLFLSVKVLGSDESGADQSPALKTQELLNILRRGSSALDSAPTAGMDIATFIATPIAEILRMSKERGETREAKLKQEVEGVKIEEDLAASVEEEERLLLSGVARVRGKLFEGQVHVPASNKDIATEWENQQKRERNNRLVNFNGIQHILDPSPVHRVASASTKRKRATFEHEDWCIYCRDGGDVVLCSQCPRVFHAKCHGISSAEVQSTGFISCSQHDCAVCLRKTADAGGMLFRCQTCPQAFCEDCLPPGELCAVGPSLPEFVVLGVGEKAQAFFIRCHDCLKQFHEEPQVWATWQAEFKETEAKLASFEQW